MRRAWVPALVVGLLGTAAALFLLRPQGDPVVAATSPPDIAAEAREVAVQTLRSRLRDPDAAVFRDIHVWRYGPEDERAVCGAIASSELGAGGGGPFVMRVVLPEAELLARSSGRPGMRGAVTILEDGPGLIRPSPFARQRFCRDADAPEPAPAAAASPAPRAQAVAVGPSGPGEVVVTEGGGALSQVIVSSPANLRAGPGGGAAVLSVVPRGRVLEVFDRAPGGWVRVGDDQPWGWIHGSLLSEDAPRP